MQFMRLTWLFIQRSPAAFQAKADVLSLIWKQETKGYNMLITPPIPWSDFYFEGLMQTALKWRDSSFAHLWLSKLIRVDRVQVKNASVRDKNLDGQTSWKDGKILDYSDKCPAELVKQAISQVSTGVTQRTVESYSIILIKILKAS